MIKTTFLAMAAALVGFSAHADDLPPWQHALSLYGDVKYEEGFTHFDYVNPNAPKGGILRQGVQGTFETFNTYSNTRDSAASGLGMMYDSLLRMSSDESMTGYGLLAARMRMAEDRSWVDYEMRSDARWHDGTPVTAHDVVFTFTYLASDDAPPAYKRYYASIKSVEALDDMTVRFTFHEGAAREMPITVGTQDILPAHYWEACVGRGDDDAENYDPACAGKDLSRPTSVPALGSGPYRVRVKGTNPNNGTLIYDFAMGSFITYERVRDYWGQNLPVNRGMFNFDALRFDYFSDADVLTSMFMQGVYDIRHENKAQNWAEKYVGSNFDAGHILTESIETYNTEGMQGFIFNLRQDRFNSLPLRQAMQYMMNFEEMNRSFFFGQYARKCSFFGNSPMMADGLPSAEEKAVLDELRALYGEDAVNDAAYAEACRPVDISTLSESDRQKAALNLLSEAGYTYRDGALRDASGQALKIELLLVSPAFERIGLHMQNLMEAVGIEFVVTRVDQAQYVRRIYGGEFDIVVMSYGGTSNPGPEQENYWSSEAADTPNSANYLALKNPAVDDVIARIVASDTREELTFNARMLDRLLQSGSYVIPNWGITVDRIAFWNKFGYPLNERGERPYSIGGSSVMTWWQDQDLAASVASSMQSNPLETYTYLGQDTSREVELLAPVSFVWQFWAAFIALILGTGLVVYRWVNVADE